MGIFKKINFGLTKTRNKMAGAIDDMLDSFDEVTDDLYTELEEILVMGDVGVTTAVEITEKLREEVAKGKIKGAEAIRQQIKTIVAEMLYGVTMQEEGVSKILELKTAEMARKLGLA